MELVILGGRVLTMNSRNDWAEAVAVEDGKIAGSRDQR